MSFEIDIVKRRGDVDVACRMATGGGLTALLGPSGAGKTSILDMIAGLLRPDAGRIEVGGRTLFGGGVDLRPEQRRAGYVFQDMRLFPHLKVGANLSYGRSRPGSSPAMANAADDPRRGVTDAHGAAPDPKRQSRSSGDRLEANRESERRLDFLGIGHLLGRWPRTLSGGEARRVAIGRALLSDPDFLLLDEPLSSLDRARREEVALAIEQLRDRGGLPILLVTHDRGEAERLATDIVEL